MRKAIDILELGIKNVRRCSQTADTLSRAYTEIGEYDKAIAASDRAVEATAYLQPSSNESFILWHRAVAEDSLIHKTIAEGGDETRSNSGFLDLCRQCVIDYVGAMVAPDAWAEMKMRGEARVGILKTSLLRVRVEAADLDNVLSAYERAASGEEHGSAQGLQRLSSVVSDLIGKGLSVSEAIATVASAHKMEANEFTRLVAEQEGITQEVLMKALTDAATIPHDEG